jgi:hypothetical protein
LETLARLRPSRVDQLIGWAVGKGDKAAMGTWAR